MFEPPVVFKGKFVAVEPPKPKYPICENAKVLRSPSEPEIVPHGCYAGTGKWFVTANSTDKFVALFLCDQCLESFNQKYGQLGAAVTVQDAFAD